MNTSTRESYTAKLTDGPLEGKTISRNLESDDAQHRIEIAGEHGKRYVYVFAGGLEFEAEGDERPTAADYRFSETVFD